MGKLAKTLGVGVKGHLRLELDRESYCAGDMINGAIFLTVEKEFQCNQALTLTVSGSEGVSWITQHGDEYTSKHEKSKSLLHQTLAIDGHDGDLYTPGEYVYPFSYQLSPTLPGSFHVANRFTGAMSQIRAEIKYLLKAQLPVQGALSADLSAEWTPKVYPVPTPQILQPLELSTDREVWMMTLLQRGSCQLSISMDRDTFFSSEELQMHCLVSNQSAMNVRSVSLRLHRDFLLHHTKERDTRLSSVLLEIGYPGVKAGKSSGQILKMNLGAGPFSRNPIRASMTSEFFSWRYRLEVRCNFFMSPSVNLEFPVTILPIGSIPLAREVASTAVAGPSAEQAT